MATAKTKSRAATRLARRVADARVSAAMEFRIFEDNGGSYHWTIVAGDGATLARSEAFASYDEAEVGAQHVRAGAASAPVEDGAVGAELVDLIAHRDATIGDSDAGRWLDEGGSFSSETVAKWQAPR
jgi:uncharacterized protein YegP (UPF0339 family)